MFWATNLYSDPATLLQKLHDWEPHFALQVSIRHSKVLHDLHGNDIDSIWGYADTVLANSCHFHERIVHDKDACRARIMQKAHVFVALIESCAKDGIRMVKEQEKTNDPLEVPGQLVQSDGQ